MRKHFGMLTLAVGVGAVLLISTVAYTVDELKDVAVIKTFGRITAVQQGKKDAGLRFKWPWPIQKLVRYDKRTAVFEDTSEQITTGDKRHMLVTMYCAWRIADPEKFHRQIVHRKAAQKDMRGLLRAHKKTVVGKHDMADFVNTDPRKMKILEIEKEVFELVSADAMEDYGIEVVRVGLKNLVLPESATKAVIEAMQEERQKEALDLKTAGEAHATAIIERARSASTKILRFADRKAGEIRTEGYRAAAKYYADYGEDYKLSMFLRQLETLRTILKSNSVFMLDGSRITAIKWLRTQEPSLGDLPGPKTLKAPAASPKRPDPRKADPANEAGAPRP